jgi:N-acetylmuramoyl-L-alanine amidase
MTTARALRGVLAGLSAALLAAGLAVPAAAAPDDDATTEEAVAQRALTSSRPLLGWRIALDPGHNGGNADDVAAANQPVSDGRDALKPCNSVGTETLTGYPEHAFTLDVAERLRDDLERLGATVLLTREDDDGVGPCVDVRGRFAEDVDADLMISIHANGTASTSAEGFFAIVASPAISASQGVPSLDLAEDMIEALSDAGFAPSSTVEGALSERADLATLNFARRPAVMLELGEMRNPGESAVMESGEGREAYAEAILNGVLAWTDTHDQHGE